MAYNNNIPQGTDPLKVSQSQILANFQEILTFFGVNHVNFGQLDQGKHNFLQMPRQVGAPTTGATECAIYSALGATSAVTEMAFRRENNGTVIPFTEGSNTQSGWTRMPSGLVMKWNSVNVTFAQGNSGAVLTIPMPDPPTLMTAFWGIVVPAADPLDTTRDVNAACYVTALASNQISYRIWRRDRANTAGTNQGPLDVYGLLLGVE